ncbi:MAG: hypothetical protein ABFS34_06190 [Gemmatimonadota bacterium]
MRNTLKLGAIAAIATLAMPADVLAQVCVGEPVGAGQSSLQFGLGFPGGGTAYSGSVRSNPAGAVSYEAGYTLTDADNAASPNMHTISGRAEYELPLQVVGACASGGLGWSTASDDGGDLTAWSIPLGVGFGLEMPTQSGFSIIPHVMPMFVWQRVSVEALGLTVSASDTAFGFLGGLTVGTESIFGAVRVTTTTFEGDDATFSLEGGFLF